VSVLRNDVAVCAGREDLNGVGAGVSRINVVGGVGVYGATAAWPDEAGGGSLDQSGETLPPTPEQKTSIDPSLCYLKTLKTTIAPPLKKARLIGSLKEPPPSGFQLRRRDNWQ
jgi:hypothetical protein